MTRRATFSEADLRRAIRVAEQEGRELAGCKIRSRTFAGVADACADQWGGADGR